MTPATWLVALAILCFFCALVPAILFVVNLRYYAEPRALADLRADQDSRALANPRALDPGGVATPPPAVSVLIPARNEAAGIGDALRAVLGSRDAVFEVIVMDDGSTDDTAAIVRALAERDPRVRLEQAPPLPAGWNGKQHACWALARAARQPVLCFVDADVRLAPDCLPRMAGFLDSSGSALVSGFPRQVTGTFLEWLLLPLIHFVLLGFLPIARMRLGTDPAFAAGCGQFMMARREDYFRCGGHSGIRLTMHDGLRLPKLFREHGLRTDLADITHLATCRMYTSAAQVWSGLAKNAVEGIAAPARIVPVSILLILGQVLPFVCALAVAVGVLFNAHTAWLASWHPAFIAQPSRELYLPGLLLLLSLFFAWLPRVLAAWRFRQDWRSALLHPAGIVVLLGVQWYALIRKLAGSPVSWRDRTYTKAEEA